MNRTLFCKVCGEKFIVPDWEIRKRDPKYCSRKCSGKVNPARFKPGKEHWNYKNGSMVDSDGYIRVLDMDNPRAKSGYVLEHILVMEKYLGRMLTKDEVVHHKNENRKDNRIENLQLMTRAEHVSYHNDVRFGRKPSMKES